MNGKYTQIFLSFFLSSIKNARINVPMCNSSDSLTVFVFFLNEEAAVSGNFIGRHKLPDRFTNNRRHTNDKLSKTSPCCFATH